MIYKCENCKNRENCCENKAEYTALTKVVENVVKLDREPEFRAWFSLTMRCDYFQEDPDITMRAAESAG